MNHHLRKLANIIYKAKTHRGYIQLIYFSSKNDQQSQYVMLNEDVFTSIDEISKSTLDADLIKLMLL